MALRRARPGYRPLRSHSQSSQHQQPQQQQNWDLSSASKDSIKRCPESTEPPWQVKPFWVDRKATTLHDYDDAVHLPQQKQQHEEELLRTFCDEGELHMALDFLSRIHSPPSNNTYMSILKACIKTKSLPEAMQVHAHVAKHKDQLTGMLGDYLVMTLAKCGAIEDAYQLAHTLPHRTVFSWTAMISACADCGRGQEALEMHQDMQQEGVQPNHYTFVSLFKACGTIPNLKQGKTLHADACRMGLEFDVFIKNTLVSMYGKCEAIAEAEYVFGTLSKQDTVSWNVMLYVELRRGEKALLLYRQMQEEGMSPDKHTFVFALQACSILAEKEEGLDVEGQLIKVSSLEIGQALHADARKKGFTLDAFLGNTLVSMYGKCGTFVEAEDVFCALSQRDVMSWTAMLSTYVEQGQGEKALRLYRQMLEEGVSPERHTLVVALQASGTLEKEEVSLTVHGRSTKQLSMEIREALHADARRKGFASDAFVVTTLVNMYGKSGMIAEAGNVFNVLPRRDIVSWTAMLSAYVEQGQGEKVLQLYRYMQEEGMCPDQHVLVISLQACRILAEKEEALVVGEQSIKVKSLDIGQALHADVRRKGYASNVFVGNALVIMYGKCGDIVEAEAMFSTLSQRDVVSWTAMLSAYVEQGQGEKALLLYKQIQNEHVILDDRALLCILQACSETGNLETCNQLHFDIFSAGYDVNVLVAASLIHAYASCASMLNAQAVLDCLPQPDVASWTAGVAGYAGEGNCVASLHVFEKMQLAGCQPNGVTFTSILSACSHTGHAVIGLEYFDLMIREYGMSADLRHYGSLVDLLGRAGDFKKLENILRRMPMQADLTIWFSLLAACRIHGNVELGKQAFDHAVNLQPKQTAAYDLMISIYADAGLQECAG